jgi:nitrite reductase/ring-hydroxylating ferredoxin subunit
MSSLSSVAPVATRASARAQSSDRVAERRAVAAPGRASGPQVAPRLGDADASRAPARRGAGVVPRARKGMLADTLDGDGKKKKKDKKASKTAGPGGGSDSIAGSLEPAFAGQSKSSKPAGKNWIEVGNVSADFQTKPIKPLVLANGNFILVKWEDLVFCADCNSTAYQYPLIDGELFFGAGGPAIRVPLDGTEYDLTTGEVITWCPKNNPIRSALGTLKGAAEQVPLPVYPVSGRGGWLDFYQLRGQSAGQEGVQQRRCGNDERGKGRGDRHEGGGRERSRRLGAGSIVRADAGGGRELSLPRDPRGDRTRGARDGVPADERGRGRARAPAVRRGAFGVF